MVSTKPGQPPGQNSIGWRRWLTTTRRCRSPHLQPSGSAYAGSKAKSPPPGGNRGTSRPHLALRGTTRHYVAQDRPLHVVVGGCALSSEGVCILGFRPDLHRVQGAVATWVKTGENPAAARRAGGKRGGIQGPCGCARGTPSKVVGGLFPQRLHPSRPRSPRPPTPARCPPTFRPEEGVTVPASDRSPAVDGIGGRLLRTTRWPRASSPRSSASCSIVSASAPRARRRSRSSTSLRASTILDGDTRHSDISRQSSSNVRRQPEPGFARVSSVMGPKRLSAATVA